MNLLILLLLIFTGVFIYNKLQKVDYNPSVYETELISYFKEVALQTEFGDNSDNRILKWKKPMQIYVIDANKRQLKAINKAISKINSLILNDFKVELVDEQKKCNTILYVCSMDKIENLDYVFYKTFTNIIEYEVDGYAYINWNNYNYELNKASIYINPLNSVEIHESTILEEITQCIGLPNDSEKYSNSIFYENKSEEDINIFEFSPLDKDVIQLLYHPRIKAGMNTEQVENEILKIFKNREIKLYGNYTGIKSYNHS